MQLLLLPLVEDMMQLSSGVSMHVNGVGAVSVSARLVFVCGDYRAVPKVSLSRQAPAKRGACFHCDIVGTYVSKRTTYRGSGTPRHENTCYHSLSENKQQQKACAYKGINVLKLFLPYWKNERGFVYCWAHGIANMQKDMWKRLQNTGSKKVSAAEVKAEGKKLRMADGDSTPPWAFESKTVDRIEADIHNFLACSEHRKRGIGKKSPFFTAT